MLVDVRQKWRTIALHMQTKNSNRWENQINYEWTKEYDTSDQCARVNVPHRYLQIFMQIRKWSSSYQKLIGQRDDTKGLHKAKWFLHQINVSYLNNSLQTKSQLRYQ